MPRLNFLSLEYVTSFASPPVQEWDLKQASLRASLQGLSKVAPELSHLGRRALGRLIRLTVTGTAFTLGVRSRAAF